MKSDDEEIWKELTGLPKYHISSLGRIKSFMKYPSGKILTPRKNQFGYRQVCLILNDGSHKFVLIHRIVMGVFVGLKDGFVVDHINNIKDDNRLCNLQLITPRENINKSAKRSSRYPGITWRERDKRWQAKILIGDKIIYLGYFKNEVDAATAYQNAIPK